MKRILMLLADGYEDVEALGTRDYLLRANQEVITSSIKDDDMVISSFKARTHTDLTLKNLNYQNFDCLILPGGGLGVKNLLMSQEVKEIIKYFYDHHKLIASICAAPSILGKYGYLENKKYTCYAGFNNGFAGIFTGDEVVISDNIITARAMNYYQEFARAILNKLGEEKAITQVERAISGLYLK